MKENQEFLETVESLGNFIQYWGFKSIHGKVWGYIYLSDRPVSTPEIVEFLGVSKGLVSVAINELLNYKLVLQLDKAKYGALTYVAASDPATTVRNVLRERELKILEQTESGLKKLSKLDPNILEKLNLSQQHTKDLLSLTVAHKNILEKLVKKNINTLEQWKKFLEKGLKFLR